jgi:dGTPase
MFFFKGEVMDWNKLLRISRNSSSDSQLTGKELEARSEFQRDFDRIVFSTAFRRLQDKTQVIPFPEKDFVHNRLTHSIEVSSVGRSLGNLAGNYILSKNSDLIKKYTASDFSSIVQAASLCHDIGNPPFGHFGEKSISDYFLFSEDSEQIQDLISGEEKDRFTKCWTDLTKFEGNASGFRILRKKIGEENSGINLTLATLGAFLKYPRESGISHSKNIISEKKFGIFQTEIKEFKNIAFDLGLISKSATDIEIKYARHPLAYLVEAADDICYTIIDFEDGVRHKLINSKDAEHLLIAILDEAKEKYDKLASIKDKNERIGYLRAKIINFLIFHSIEEFKQNYDNIMAGNQNTGLTDSIFKTSLFINLKNLIEEFIYKNENVIQHELAGYEILPFLLDKYIKALVIDTSKRKDYYDKSLLLFPYNLQKRDDFSKMSTYEKIMIVCEFVSVMTDNYAISLYRKMKGISSSNKF